MSALTAKPKIVVDAKGKPLEVIIPYEQYVEFVEAYGLDLPDDERNSILRAKSAIEKGDYSEFLSAEAVKNEIECTR